MNFTREPLIESIITPKEGYKLVIRSSKAGGQEEFFVDSVQVITLGQHCFYRSLEKPKPFLVPANDYEILEMRETRMVVKMPNAERGGIKIAGGREAPMKVVREAKEPLEEREPSERNVEPAPVGEEKGGDRRKERKRFRKRRGDRFAKDEEGGEVREGGPEEENGEIKEENRVKREEKPSLIPPPTTLISETISRYKDIPTFAGAFFSKEEEAAEKGFQEDSGDQIEVPSTFETFSEDSEN